MGTHRYRSTQSVAAVEEQAAHAFAGYRGGSGHRTDLANFVGVMDAIEADVSSKALIHEENNALPLKAGNPAACKDRNWQTDSYGSVKTVATAGWGVGGSRVFPCSTRRTGERHDDRRKMQPSRGG